MSCFAHPYYRFAQILRRGPSVRPLVGAHAAPYQPLVHRVIGAGQLLPSLGRRIDKVQNYRMEFLKIVVVVKKG